MQRNVVKIILFLLPVITGELHAQNLENLKKNPPVTLHGSVSAGLNYYTAFSGTRDTLSSISFGHTPSYFIQANPVLTLYGYAIPINILIASQNKSFNTPFNRFGMSPYYKWIKLHLGWRSLNFSQFTLSGQQMLGAGFELTPGKFRMAFIYGKLNDAVTDISLYNNLNNNIPLYKRKGFAAMVGYGSASNYLELSYLQAKDDSSSISSLSGIQVKPAANQVLGLKGQLTILKVLYINVDAAGSYYTNDITSGFLETDNQWAKLASFAPRISSRISSAGEAAIRYQFKTGNVNFKYRRVDPDYQSMGAFYMQTDIEQYTFGVGYTFLKNKIHLRSDIGWQRNNLAKTSVNDSKRTIGNIALNISPSSAFGIDINYSNYGISQQIIPQLTDPGTIIRYDSVRISQVNQSISISPHLFLKRKALQHSISLQASFQKLHNSNEAQSNQDFTSSMSSLVYALIFPEQRINISSAVNYFNTRFTGNNSATIGCNLGVTKNIVPQQEEKKKAIKSVSLTLSGGYFANSLNHQSTGKTFSLNPAIGVVFLGKHSVQLTTNYTNVTNNQTTGNTSRQQLMISTRYNMSF